MPEQQNSRMAVLPSVDSVLNWPEVAEIISRHGRPLVTGTLRTILAASRDQLKEGAEPATRQDLIAALDAEIADLLSPSLRPVFNLTGTVLHTNLGRAPMPEEALDAIRRVSLTASNLEYDLETGKRGDRDDHLEALICRLTGAEAATVVNNNAAAVLLVLNSLALRKEVVVSRGELIEIGGSFRIPDIMSRAGAKLHEVGTTNRTHAADFSGAISVKTGLLLKVHASNYAIEGFTASVPESELARIASEADIPFVCDLGSGTLTDLTAFGLPHEPTAGETLASGADIVTFSGDKLLGGPQAGFIIGSKDLIRKIKKNPLKRALRVDKMTIAALETILRMYLNPEDLRSRLPAINILSRTEASIQVQAERLLPKVSEAFDSVATVTVSPCSSQIGSGSLPVEILASCALAVTPKPQKKSTGRILKDLSQALRQLPIPVLGRIHNDTLLLDLRCLTDEQAFIDQLGQLAAGL